MKLQYFLFGTLCFQLCNVELEAKSIIAHGLAYTVLGGVYAVEKLYLAIAETGCWPNHIDSNAFLGKIVKYTLYSQIN